MEDIIASANKILTYTDGLSYEQFLSDDKIVDAVIRNFEIIGETANRLPAKNVLELISVHPINKIQELLPYHLKSTQQQ